MSVTRIGRLFLAGLLTVSLAFGQNEMVAQAEPVAPTPAPAAGEKSTELSDSNVEPTGSGLVRPDWVSAATTARLAKARVEVLSERTESSRTWSLPDGTALVEQFTGDVRFPDATAEADGWRDIDTTLKLNADGSVSPRAVPESMVLSGGGSDAPMISRKERSGVKVNLDPVEGVDLPAPSIEGSTATYVDVKPGVDVRVEVRPDGFQWYWVVKDPVAAKSFFKKASDGQLGVSAGLSTRKGSWSEAQSEIRIRDTKGHLSGRLGAPLVWDAAEIPSTGEAANVVEGDLSADELGTATATVGVSVDADWLNDPERVYPITVDPSYASVTTSPSFDTYVYTNYTNTDLSTQNNLRIGNDGAGGKMRTYMNFSRSPFAGKKIMSAKLHLWEYQAWSCTPTEWKVYDSDPASTSTRWASQPTYRNVYGKSSETKGESGCADGYVSVSIPGLIQKWANESTSTRGVMVRAISESEPSGHKKFNSKEASSHPPRLVWTYDRAPATPSVSTLLPASGYQVYSSVPYLATTSPVIKVTTGTDADANTVRAEIEAWTAASGGTKVASCVSGYVTGGASASCTLSPALTAESKVWIQARSFDAYLASGWTSRKEMRVAAAKPAVPVVSCPAPYDNGSWSSEVPASAISCTISAAGSGYSAPSKIRYQVDGGAISEAAITQSADPAVASRSITVPNSAGGHTIAAWAAGPSGLVSNAANYAFGLGDASVSLPAPDDRSTSTFPVQASGPGGATSAVVQWRYAPDVAGDTTSGWTTASQVRLKSSGAAWTGTVETDAGQSRTPLLTWNASAEDGISVPALVQLRVVFTYNGGVTNSSPLRRVILIPHAFGGSYPTQEVGSGTVALFTGEFQVSESDVSVPGYGGGLTFGRTHLTLTGDQAGPSGVFGPGWTADFAGQGAGLGGYVVTDNTAVDGTFLLTSPDGEANVYAHESGTRGSLRTGFYDGVGETALTEDMLELTTGGGTGISHTLTLTEEDGTVTVFQRTTGGVWVTATTTEPEDNSTVRFAHNTEGLITWVFAPAPQGVTCTEAVQERGCRALKFTYQTINGGARLTKVQYRAWDPKPGTDGKPTAAAAMATIDVAGYGYDAQGRLTQAWEPNADGDNGEGRKTLYEYTTINTKTVVTQITDPGLVPWRMEYETGTGRLATVKRALDPAVASGDATWKVAYDVPLSGAGLPDLTSAATETWGQPAADAPTGAAAVFGPDHTPGWTVSDQDWPWASISYFTAAGKTTNAAVFGAGEWLIDSTRYDAHGNATWTLSASARQAAMAEPNPASDADKYASITVYNEAGTRVEETYSPMREVVLDDGTTTLARTKVETLYDDEAQASLMPGRPTSDVPEGGYNLAIEQSTSVSDQTDPTASGNTWDVKKVRYRYDAVSSGDASGWTLRVPTRTLTQDGSGWATTITRYDTEGKTVETRTPAGTAISNAAGTDTYSTLNAYYTADASSPVAACRNAPEWAGSTCITYPAGEPSSGHAIPANATTGYNLRGAATRTEEIADGWTRAEVTEFDYLGNATSSATSLTGHDTITGATSYDSTTGAVLSTSGNGKTEDFTYDTWGRTLTATDGTGNTATTSYDTAGRVGAFNDGKGLYTYTYDGTDSLGRTERRGLMTRVDLGYAEGEADVVTGAYDSAGALLSENLPDGYTATWERNIAGQTTSLGYAQLVEGEVTPVAGFSQTFDHLGRVVTATGPAGTRHYTYDDRAHLSSVEDTTETGCTTRVYSFEGDSNRTSLATYAPTAEGECQTSEVANTTTYSYDQADRITGGYTYDRLGRTTVLPKRDTSQAGVTTASDAAITYAANDMVSSIEQTIPDTEGVAELRHQDFVLDASNRISEIEDFTDGTQLGETLNHYDGDSDSPAWTQHRTRADGQAAWATTWQRYLADLTGDLGLSVDDTGTVSVQFANPHGDIVTTATVGQPGLDSYAESDEYGQASDPTAAQPRYGWLGAKQRDTGSVLAGLTLMGARLYNSATGRFLSIDPVAGGNDNRYTYPADPINKLDLDGEYAFAIPVVAGGIIIRIIVYAAIAYVAFLIAREIGIRLGKWILEQRSRRQPSSKSSAKPSSGSTAPSGGSHAKTKSTSKSKSGNGNSRRSNQEVKGDHNTNKRNGDKHDTANARRAREQKRALEQNPNKRRR